MAIVVPSPINGFPPFNTAIRWFVPGIQDYFCRTTGLLLTAGPALGSQRFYCRGSGFIAGVVTVAGQPASRPVRVYDRETGMFLAEVQSAEDGSYRIDGLNAGRLYLVVAHDSANVYNAAPADQITPAPE